MIYYYNHQQELENLRSSWFISITKMIHQLYLKSLLYVNFDRNKRSSNHQDEHENMFDFS